jgi:hypothetical protein
MAYEKVLEMGSGNSSFPFLLALGYCVENPYRV